MDIWNWLQENSGVLALLVPLAGMLYAGFARMYKALDAVAERRHKRLEERQKRLEDVQIEVLERLTGVEEGQKRLEEGQKRLEERQTRVEEGQKRLEERQTRLEESQKEVAKSVDDMKGDIRAIWHPALGAFFGQKNGQRSDNHPDVTSRS